MSQFGVVIIGRNEGNRLVKCLESMQENVKAIIYVDSGSTDDSVAMSRKKGIFALELDVTIPFTAARARNEGFSQLMQLQPKLTYVQFVDGDCEVVEGWLKSAVNFLEQNKNVAVVCGRRRERFPDRSIYNMLCDIEWDTPVGEAKACGGDAMMRVAAFEQVGGFAGDLIAGEEPELCVRLRQHGWNIWRVDKEMTLHDAAMTRFSQWWKRATRAGYTYAEGAYLQGLSPDPHWVRKALSPLLWGLGVPLSVVTLLVLSEYWGLTILVLYPIQILRIYRKGGGLTRDNWWFAYFIVLGKFPEMVGVLRFFLQQFLDGKKGLIEYK